MDSKRAKLGRPPPLWGRAGEGGWCSDARALPHRATPPTPPQGGGERTECAALFCINTSGNRFSARHRCPAMPLKDHDAREHIAARAEAGPHDVS